MIPETLKVAFGELGIKEIKGNRKSLKTIPKRKSHYSRWYLWK